MLNFNKVYCGDSLELLTKIPSKSVDALVTDPPFVFAGGMSNGRSSECSDQFFLHWWKDVCKELNRVMKDDSEGFIWCDWRSAMTIAKGFERNQEYGLKVAQMLYHYREMPGNGAPFRSSVDMLAYVRGFKSDAHRISNTTHNLISKYWYYGKHENHPAEKDIEIVKKLLDWCSDRGDVVLDPFMGSGTVPIACVRAGRQFVGFDICEDFFKVAEGRLKTERMPSITAYGTTPLLVSLNGNKSTNEVKP